MKIYFITLILAIGFQNIFAQLPNGIEDVEELIKKGIELHDAREYKQAIETYKKALDK